MTVIRDENGVVSWLFTAWDEAIDPSLADGMEDEDGHRVAPSQPLGPALVLQRWFI